MSRGTNNERAHHLRFLGFPNLLAAPSSRVQAGSEYSASYAIENVLTIDPAQPWRSASYLPDDAGFISYYDTGTAFPGVGLDAVGLVSHNIWDLGGCVRFIFSNGGTLFDIDMDLEEVGFLSSLGSNADGDHTDLGAISGGSPAGVGATAPANSWSLSITCDTPSNNPRREIPPNDVPYDTGATDAYFANAHYQSFLMYVSIDNASTDLEPYKAPTLVVSVGSFEVARKKITRLSGQWVYVSFMIPDSIPADGSGLSIVIAGEPGYDNSNVRVERMRWRCEADEITGNAGVEYDTGWIPGGYDTAWVTAGVENPALGYAERSQIARRDLYHALPSMASPVKVVYTLFRVDHVPNIESYSIAEAGFPPGYVQLGHIVGGIELVPNFGQANGGYISYTDHGSKSLSSGLGTYGQALGVRRNGLLNMRTLTVIESNIIEDRVLSKGFLKPVMISMKPQLPGAVTLDGRLTTMFATLKNAENPVGHREVDTGDYPRSMNLLLEEFR